MRDRKLRGLSANLGEASCGPAVQPQLRRSAWPTNHLDVAPKHALRVSGAERFHRRFFGCEPACEMNRRMMASHAVFDLAVREDPVSEAIAVPVERGGNTRNIGRVESKSDDGHASTA